MANQQSLSDLRTTLREMEALLASEREALRTLDRTAIMSAASKKLEFDTRLRQLIDGATAPSDDDRVALDRVRSAALVNQVLLAHARACVRGALSIATGRPLTVAPSATSAGRPAAAATALRVNVRG